MALTTLLEAVKTQWYGNSGLTDLVTGGLYLSQVPDTLQTSKISLPFATCDSDRTRFEWTETKLYYEITTLEFNVYATSASDLEGMIAQLRTVFDWQSLTFADGVSSSTYVQPLDFHYTAEPLRDREDLIVYRACMRYEVWVNRQFSPYV